MEGRTAANFTFNNNLARVLLDDAVRDGQAQPGTAPLAFLRSTLGSEKWIINTLHIFRRNSHAAICNRDGYVSIALGPDQQTSSSRHRIACIQEEIQEDLLQFAGIPHDGRQNGIERQIDFNLRSFELVLEQRQGFADRVVQIDFLEFGRTGAPASGYRKR